MQEGMKKLLYLGIDARVIVTMEGEWETAPKLSMVPAV